MASFTSAELRSAVNLIHVGSAEAIAQALHAAYERGYRAAKLDVNAENARIDRVIAKAFGEQRR